MQSDMLRVGLVGAGTNTKLRHIPGLQAISGVEVVSVCNRSRASSEKVAKQFGIKRVYDHWRELIDAEDFLLGRAGAGDAVRGVSDLFCTPVGNEVRVGHLYLG